MKSVILGLTGGISTGKTLVSSIFRELGVSVIDVDQMAHEIILPGNPAHKEIISFFGTEILQPDGTIDRKRLAKLVFEDEEFRRRLEAITHPRIITRVIEAIQLLRKKGVPIQVIDAPLLFETGLNVRCDAVITVYAKPQEQLKRLVKRDNITLSEAKQRIAAQMPLTQKVGLSEFVIDNSLGLENTKAQVVKILEEVKRNLEALSNA